ncbi:hypothetical protein [uncultured Brevundimonas sp.]|mgnify:CR=1 FL=1|uniref:hypothetical protein n=1 Tax=uncultured Brevundimonas sp. TaxID=213418 RepID=UPI0030EB3BF9|tara:strand:+ start:12192 stop:12503 length:312 start_codon:yes stop_codon:yes gene_type:complete
MPQTQHTRPDLRLVGTEAEIYDLMQPPRTTADRVRRLQQEARALAVEQVEALETALTAAADLAREIADGGDAYPVGTREMASRLATDLPARAGSLRAVIERSR